MKKTILFGSVFCFLCHFSAGPCFAATLPSAYSPTFALAIQGSVRMDLSSDILSFTFEDNPGKLEITMNNWDARGYKYSDGNLFIPGNQVGLYVVYGSNNPQKMWEGTITSLAPKYLTNAPPTLTFVATGISAQIAQQGQPPTPVEFGKNLFELNLNLRNGVIEAIGVTEGNPNLRSGTLLTIDRVGQRFNGLYSVSRTNHLLERTRGYTTRFTASRIFRR